MERKSLNDLVGCLMGKDRAFDFFAVVVEAALSDVLKGRYRSEMQPQAVLQSLIAFQVRYRLSILWAGNREGAECVTYSLLQKYLREIGERYKQAVKTQGDNGGKEPRP